MAYLNYYFGKEYKSWGDLFEFLSTYRGIYVNTQEKLEMWENMKIKQNVNYV